MKIEISEELYTSIINELNNSQSAWGEAGIYSFAKDCLRAKQQLRAAWGLEEKVQANIKELEETK